MAQCSELASHNERLYQSSLVQPLIVLTAPLPRPIAEIHLTDEQQNPTAKQPTRIYHFRRAQRPLRRKLNPTFTKTPRPIQSTPKTAHPYSTLETAVDAETIGHVMTTASARAKTDHAALPPNPDNQQSPTAATIYPRTSTHQELEG
jgi:hypothetical protein